MLHACLPIFEPWATDEVKAGEPQRIALGFPGDVEAIEVEVGDGIGFAAQNHPRSEVGDVDEVDPVEALLALSRRAHPQTEPVRRFVAWFEPI